MIADLACIPILLWIAVEDGRRYRIRNLAVGLLALCVLASWLDGRHASLAATVLFAATVFAGLVGAFALRWIGGGDAKLLTLALAYAGPSRAATFALLLIVSVLAYAAVARHGLLPSRGSGRRRQIPYGPSIAAAWILLVALGWWTARLD